MSSETVLASLSDYVNTRTLPPVEKWHPENESSIDIRIDKSGNWIHEGGLITRPAMVRVFSSVLRQEEQNYYLVTPEVKLKIQVEDVPFLVTNMESFGKGRKQIIAFVTGTGDYVTLDSDHILVIEDHGPGLKPYLMIRQGMQALLSRPVYYQLAELCTTHKPSPQSDSCLGVWSSGLFCNLTNDPNT